MTTDTNLLLAAELARIVKSPYPTQLKVRAPIMKQSQVVTTGNRTDAFSDLSRPSVQRQLQRDISASKMLCMSCQQSGLHPRRGPTPLAIRP